MKCFLSSLGLLLALTSTAPSQGLQNNAGTGFPSYQSINLLGFTYFSQLQTIGLTEAGIGNGTWMYAGLNNALWMDSISAPNGFTFQFVDLQGNFVVNHYAACQG